MFLNVSATPEIGDWSSGAQNLELRNSKSVIFGELQISKIELSPARELNFQWVFEQNMQNTRHMHLKLSSRSFLELHKDPKSSSKRLSGAQKLTKIQQKSFQMRSESPKWRQVGPKFSQDPQMTASGPPPQPPWTVPNPVETLEKGASDMKKKNWAAFPPVANRILVFFCRQWKKLFSLLRNLPGRFPTLSKPCKNVVPIWKKKLAGIPSCCR